MTTERLPVTTVDASGLLISLPPLVDAEAATSSTAAARKTRTVVRRGGALVRTSAAAAAAGAADDKLPTLTAGSSINQPMLHHQQPLQAQTDRLPAAAGSVASEPTDLDQTVVSHWRFGYVKGTVDVAATVAGGVHHRPPHHGKGASVGTHAAQGASQTEHVRYDLPARPPRHRVTTSAVAATNSSSVGNGKQVDIGSDGNKATPTGSSQVIVNGLAAEETPKIFNRQPIPFNSDQFKFSSFVKKIPVDRRNWSNYSPLLNRCRVVVVHADRRSLQLDDSRQVNVDAKRYCNGDVAVTRSQPLGNEFHSNYLHYSRRLRLPTVTSRAADIISVPLTGLYTTADDSPPLLLTAEDLHQNTEVSIDAMDQSPSTDLPTPVRES